MAQTVDLIKADLALFPGVKSRWGTLLFFAVLLTLPLYLSSYLLDVVNRIGIFVIAAVGLNILTGFTGLISLGNAAFMATGAFSASWLAQRTGLNIVWCVPLAGLVAAALGLLIGIPSLRLRGLYLAMATLAAHFIVEYLVVHCESVTGGVAGITVPTPSVAGVPLDSDRSVFYLIIPSAALVVLLASNLFRGRTGRAFIAIRDQELSAAVMGINVFYYKMLSFAVSSFFVGVAGALLACQAKIITPENFPITLAIDCLAMVIIGGMGSVTGSVLGAAFLTVLPEVLRLGTTALSGTFPSLVGKMASLKDLVFGVLIISFLIFEPHGLVAIWKRAKRRLGER